MTFKDLQKTVQTEVELANANANVDLIDKLQGLPFWIFDQDHHRLEYRRTKTKCCFWHAIKCPQKDNHDMPVLPYQRTLYEALQNHKHIWCLKSRGIGVTTFLLRYVAWQCIGHLAPDSRVCIVTGPRLDLAEDLIDRFKGLFGGARLAGITRSTVAFLNGVKVEAFPSHHVDTMRGLDNVRFIMSDESDHYPLFQQKELRAVMEGYIGKPNSNPTIVLVSTPKAPGGLMQQIELEQDSLYHKLFFDYKYGLQGPYPIYSEEHIAKARLSPEFGREYELQYLGLVGNVFSQASIENCQKIEYNPQNIHQNVKKSIGIDPSYGSSNFAICATQLVDGKIQVIEASEYQRPNFTDMIQKIWQLKQQYGHVSNIYVDASGPEIVQALKREFEERYDDHYVKDQIAECRKYNLHIEDRMFIVPTAFSIKGAEMLQHCKWLLDEREEDGSSLIAIHPTFDKLLTALRTSVAHEYRLDKEQTAFDDILDAFRLSLQFYKRTK